MNNIRTKPHKISVRQNPEGIREYFAIRSKEKRQAKIDCEKTKAKPKVNRNTNAVFIAGRVSPDGQLLERHVYEYEDDGKTFSPESSKIIKHQVFKKQLGPFSAGNMLQPAKEEVSVGGKLLGRKA